MRDFLSRRQIVKLPPDVQQFLDEASRPKLGKTASTPPKFQCRIFNSSWDQFVELWAPRVYIFVENALGPYGTAPLPEILRMHDGQHSAGATASFDLSNGQVRLAGSVEGKPGQTLEKLCHEFIHGSLSQFPEGDTFYEEGFVDYSVFVCAHAPTWEPYRSDMITAAELNIKLRRDRGMLNQSDFDRKRWMGGLFAMLTHGPHIVSNFRMKKVENNFTW